MILWPLGGEGPTPVTYKNQYVISPHGRLYSNLDRLVECESQCVITLRYLWGDASAIDRCGEDRDQVACGFPERSYTDS